MKRSLRAALLAAAIVATLAFANSAFAAFTAKMAVSHAPMRGGVAAATTIHVTLPQANTVGVAQINIYAPAGYTANLGAAPGTNIGTATASVFSHDTGLTLPLEGNVLTDNPANHTSDVCSPGTHAAVWILNLSVSGQQVQIPVYVDPTAGQEQALGAYRIRVCLPPYDVPAGTPGRAVQGVQLLDTKFTTNNVFTTPATSAGPLVWDGLFTPYNPGNGTPNAAGTIEARGLLGLPVSLSLGAKYNAKKNAYSLAGVLREGTFTLPNETVSIYRGTSVAGLTKRASTKTNANGAYTTAGHLQPKKTTYFRVRATGNAEYDVTTQGCASPNPLAPGGCVSATLAPYGAAASPVIRIKLATPKKKHR